MSFLNISLLEDALGHRFQQRALLEQALTHSSYARETESQNVSSASPVQQPDNEQMEFLGDAVLAFIVSQELFRRFPQYTEGELSKLRAHIVSARHLLRPARKLEIGQYLRLGRGEDKSGGRTKSALLVNALEAVIAALFLDAGLATAQRFVLETIFEPELTELQKIAGEKFPVTDYKSALQEAVHILGRAQPRYVLVKEEGPEHRKMFTVEAHIAPSANGEPEFVSRADGSTKKLAEQGAARGAWEYLQSLQKGPDEALALP
jgi:ribonuclease-3